MLNEFRADLHIHTCLSPCADLEMSPLAIVHKAAEKGIDIIAVTDHNSAENIIAAQKAAEDTGLTVLAGMEITSSEEAHILALFDSAADILKIQEMVYEKLLPGENDEKKFGEQVVVNERDEVSSFNKRLLIGATMLSAYEIIDAVHSSGGLSVASHIDRDAFSIISQLGFISDDLKFDALEISPLTGREEAEQLYQTYKTFAWISSSDAHYLNDIGKRTVLFHMKEPTIAEMRLAFQRKDGRKVEWDERQ